MQSFLLGFLEDLRYAIRLLRRSPAITATALITLAIGIGANTTVFSIVNGVLLKPLPFNEPHRIVTLWMQNGPDTDQTVPASAVQNIQQFSRSFEFSAAYQGAFVGGRVDNPAVSLALVSPDFFRLFRVRPTIGRDFMADDLNPDAPRVAIVSHDYWQSRLAGAADVLGQLIDVPEGFSQLTIIGVLPPDTKSPASLGAPPSVWSLLDPLKAANCVPPPFTSTAG